MGEQAMTIQIQSQEKYQVLPPMPADQFEALKADIAERGVLVPIDVAEDGHILDGHHRHRACVELGITDFPTIVRPGLSDEERRVFARKNNMLRRHLNRAQRRGLLVDQLRDTPSWANNRIAGVLGIDSKTVQAERERLEATLEIPKLDKLIGADGKARSVKRKRPVAVMASNADELAAILDKLREGIAVEDLDGFLSKTALNEIHTPGYNPFAHCDTRGQWEWEAFAAFLHYQFGWCEEGAGAHVEWILQRQFRSPWEWLGDEGHAFRQTYGTRDPSRAFIKKFKFFIAEHEGRSLPQIDAAMQEGGAS